MINQLVIIGLPFSVIIGLDPIIFQKEIPLSSKGMTLW